MFDWLRAALQGRFGLSRMQGAQKTRPKKHGDKKHGKKNGKKKSPPVPPAGDGSETFFACLRRSIGGRYCLPAREPECTDCSGLVRRCYREATGLDIGGDSHEQFKLGQEIDRVDVRRGDLLFWDTQNGTEVRGGNRASHVGVSSGGNRMINALNEDLGILESELTSDYWTNQVEYLGARRLEL